MAQPEKHDGTEASQHAWLSRELAECADELAYWKYAAIWLQVKVVLGRDPTVEDESGKTWKNMRARLEAQYQSEKTTG